MPSSANDCPILIWMLSLNREYTKAEYLACHKVIEECAPYARASSNPLDPNSFLRSTGHLITNMLPLLMMRHRRVPRAKWSDHTTPHGKHWIKGTLEDSAIGYHLTYENSLCGLAMTKGDKRQVTSIGFAIKQLSVEPRGVSVAEYAESLSHKLTTPEILMVRSATDDDTKLRRLCIILALKQSYIKAIGQPIGFDWSRLEFNVPAQRALADGNLLMGWEFRLVESNIGVVRKDQIVEENYQSVCSFYRGSGDSKFLWYDDSKDLDDWVQYINIDQMMKVVHKLSE